MYGISHSLSHRSNKYPVWENTLKYAEINPLLPSFLATSTQYNIHQSNPTTAIHDGRGPQHLRNQSPPIRIYHPIFAKYAAALWSAKVEASDLELTRKLCNLLGCMDTGWLWENSRNAQIRTVLSELFGVPFQAVVSHDRAIASGAYMIQLGSVDLPGIIVELKRLFDDGGSDPFVQTELMFLRYWAQTEVSCSC